jgi:chemotaxis methyl-accepting protein methylase/signal transduction histidine kinase
VVEGAHRRAVRRRRAPIVGLAASSSSLTVLKVLFGDLTADCRVCFVVAMSFDSPETAELPDRLRAFTALPITMACERRPLEPGHIYVLPQRQPFTIERGVFRLNHSPADHESHGGIDRFFRSLATDQGDRAAAIVLSGPGAEAAIGTREVKAVGGLAIAQAPETATEPEMPNNAIALGAIDSILAPEQMAAALRAFAAWPNRRGSSAEKRQAHAEDLQSILSIVHAHTGRDFRGYKPQLLWRRIERRMRLQTFSDAGLYAAALHAQPACADRLSSDLLIKAPAFFRDPAALDELALATLARRPQRDEPGAPIRVWVPDCATGEEAYSIAMVLSEQMPLTSRWRRFQIFATDADPRTVAFARVGRYPASISMDVTPARLARFFEADGDHYKIARSLRSTMMFGVHDLRNDPPFSRIDLVSCRNVLTSFEPDARQEVLSLFHFALCPGGLLFVGRGESIGSRGALFAVTARHRQILRRRDTAAHAETRERRALAVQPPSSDVSRLETELRRSGDELKSAQATILSLNEQLKSANEELRLVSPDIITVLLDKDLRVRRFTAAAARVLRVSDLDVGRGVDEVATSLVDVDLARHARDVLKTGMSIERGVTVRGGRQFTMRLLACRRDRDETPLGVLVALVDASGMTAHERHFRLAYDALQRSNDSLERRVSERTRWLGLLHKVTRAIGDAPSWDEGLHGALTHICEHENWQLGYVYLPDADIPDTVVHAISCVRADAVLPFHSASEHRRYRKGQTLPGRVYADGTPVWLNTPGELEEWLPIRARMAEAVGLKTAVAIPVRFGNEVIAVLELFSTEVHVPSDPLVDLMHDVSDQIGNVVERERRNVQMEARIWREQQGLLHTLHDSLGQTLTGLGLMASALRKRLGTSDAAIADTSEQIALNAESALGEIRQLAKGLFPTDLDADGLVAALRQLATTTQGAQQVRVRVQEGSACSLRDHRIATNLYRIAQEAVTNSVKHADARTITIRIHTNSGLTTLRVWDDGRGIKDVEPSADGVGLRIMNYRARSIGATLSITSHRGGGTIVTCVVREALHSAERTAGHAS